MVESFLSKKKNLFEIFICDEDKSRVDLVAGGVGGPGLPTC